MRGFFLAAAAFLGALFLCGCPLKVSVDCKNDGSLFVNFSSELGQAFSESLAQIQNISAENSQNSSNLDEISRKIQSELNAHFFSGANVRFGKKLLEASASVQSIKKIPSEFAAVKKTPDGKNIFVLNLNPRSLASSILQEDSAAKTLADILMAPIISGEEMSRQEYRELLCDIYGAPLADELLAGNLTVEFIFAGKKQVKKIPVADLLLSAQGVSFEFEC